MRTGILCLALAISPVALQAASQQQMANPIRKVVNMLQMMQKKIEAEGEKEKELFDKFMCYCQNGGSDLKASIAGAGDKIGTLGSDIKAAEEQQAQTKDDLAKAQDDRSAAKTAIAEATGIREKEAAAFGSLKDESNANIAALKKAVAALEKGMAGGFLQTGEAQVLRKYVASKEDMPEADRDTVTAFLSGTQDSEYSPSSGEITGLLKQLGDEMEASLASATSTENAAIATYEQLMAAKEKEINTLTASIEVKTKRSGELAVSIVQMQNDLGDTEAALIEDKKFLAELDTTCKTKADEWDERVKTRTLELAALADTIKMLNDDDALELFKKTLPGASSFMQLTVSTSAQRSQALATIRAAQQKYASSRPGLSFIVLALEGKKVGFDEVLGMIDEMLATLVKEQEDDDNKKEYCETSLDTADDKKKVLEKSVSDLDAAIADTKEGISTTAEEIAALQKSIKALDKSVAEATLQRKEENEDFQELMASDSAAVELLGMAKNRLNKFYNPKLYKPPAKEELSRDDRIVANMGGAAVFVQVSAHQQGKADPGAPPATFGAYSKKSEESTGVIAMIDLLVQDLEKEMTEAKTGEKEAQADYETMMKDAAEKRATDSTTLNDKISTKAALDSDLETHKEDKASTTKELMATLQYIANLHGECDWLIEYYSVRKEARTGEVDALKKAKAVLSGADFALVQTRSSHLRASSRQ